MNRISIFNAAKKQSVLFVGVVLLLTLTRLALDWITLIDDAYIFFRYAHNLAVGEGYVFNRGVPAEGTTSTSWTLLLTIFAIVGVPLPSAARLLAAVSIAAILSVLVLELRRKQLSVPAMLLLAVLLIIDPNFVPSIMMGLETGLYSLLLVVFYRLAVRPKRDRRVELALGVLGMLLFLTRPESVALLGLIGLGMLVAHRTRPGVTTVVICWGVGILLVTLWRWVIFGSVLPTSMQAKSVLGDLMMHPEILVPRLAAGGGYIKGWLSASWPLVGLASIGLGRGVRASPFEWFVAVTLFANALAVALINSGDWMPFYRLMTPYLPIMVMLGGAGLQALYHQAQVAWWRRLDVVCAGLAVLSYANVLWGLREHSPFVAPVWTTGICYQELGTVLRPRLGSDNVVAPEAIGILGYTLPDVPILDFFGLTDPYIAKHGVIPIETFMMGKLHWQYVMKQEPTLFVFHSGVEAHVPQLNDWGYSEHYRTFNVVNAQHACELNVGVRTDMVQEFMPELESSFTIRPVETMGLPKNPAATWPMGER